MAVRVISVLFAFVCARVSGNAALNTFLASLPSPTGFPVEIHQIRALLTRHRSDFCLGGRVGALHQRDPPGSSICHSFSSNTPQWPSAGSSVYNVTITSGGALVVRKQMNLNLKKITNHL